MGLSNTRQGTASAVIFRGTSMSIDFLESGLHCPFLCFAKEEMGNAARRLTYTIDDGPGPVSMETVKNCVGDVRVAPITFDGTSFVEWQSSYESADESAVGEFCNPIYRALPAALKSFS